MQSLQAADTSMVTNSAPLLDVQKIAISYHGEQGDTLAVREATFTLARGEVLGIVGESGSGKSTLGLALLGLLTWPGRVRSGRAIFQGRDLLALSDGEMRALRGDQIAMVFQNPMTSLNPTETIGAQIAEIIHTHRTIGKAALEQRCAELLELVGIPAPRQRLANYPHEFSGGMRQRALIAVALALEPDLLIADEPTTALDVTVQRQILWLLDDIQQRTGMAMIYVTHNLAVAATISDRIAVMYAGWLVEVAPAAELFAHPTHPYTQGLIASMPRTHWRQNRVSAIAGQPPDLRQPPPGCPFAPRCPRATTICHEQMPPVTLLTPDHIVRCFHAAD